MFRVMRVITSDWKHFSNTGPLCIAPTQVCVCVGGGGSKNLASSFRVILGILVVSLQFELADRASCPTLPELYARAFWCTRKFAPPPPPPHKYFRPIIIPCETNIFSCHGDILNLLLEYFQHSDVRTEFLH